MRWVKLTLPAPVRARWLFRIWRLTSSSFAGTTRTAGAVGTERLASMFSTVRAAAPRRGSGSSPSSTIGPGRGTAAGTGAGAAAAAGGGGAGGAGGAGGGGGGGGGGGAGGGALGPAPEGAAEPPLDGGACWSKYCRQWASTAAGF